ncbi:MAG: PhnD/SsuA/transferrin family substrate-binding protein [Deltaproteobacteria bacterium]|nr:PhnD/SsuA/transferrin family substrate-binding protein [Deltaproteobacteria bacterium]
MIRNLTKKICRNMVIAALCLSPSICLSQEYKIGIQAYKGADKAITEWRPTAEYLTAKLGKKFTAVPLDDKGLMEAVKEGKVDFFFSNPSIYTELNRQCGAQAVATLVKSFKNQPMEYVASSILVRKDSPVQTLADFKGKEFMTRAKSSFAGWLIVKRLFLEKGIDPDRDFKAVRETKSVEHVVYAVVNGAVDGGAVIAGTLEEMAHEGKVKMEDFRLINPIADNFPVAHSTPLYPEFPMVAVAHVPANVRNEVAQALNSLTPSEPAAVSAKIQGWRKPLDYTPVADCMQIVHQGVIAKK